MWNHFYQVSLLFQISYHRFSCFVAVHSGVFSTVLLVDCCIIIHDVNLWKVVTFSNFEVVRVMCRCDLNRTCSELFVYIVIGNDWDFSVCQRQFTHLSYDVFVSFIIRMNCDRSISKQCLRTCRCDLQIVICSNDWILDMPEESVLLLMFNFCIRKRSLTYRTPVDDSGTFVNISFVI